MLWMTSSALSVGPVSMRNVIAERVSDQLIVAVYSAKTPEDEEWREYLDVLSTLEGDQSMLVLSAGGGPNTLQRRDLEAVTRRHDGRVAVVTTSRMARGIVTALSWLGTNIKAFDPRSIDDAMAYLELDEPLRASAMTRARDLATRMGVAGALQL